MKILKSRWFLILSSVTAFTALFYLYLLYPGWNWPLAGILLLFGLITAKQPLSGLKLIIFSVLFGEFARLEIFGRSLLLSDLLIFVFLGIVFWKNRFQFKLANKPKKLFVLISIFLFLAALSTLISFTFLSPQEIFPGLLYLIRLAEYLLLFPATLILINQSKNPDRLSHPELGSGSSLLKFLLLITVLLALIGFIQLIYFPDLKEFADNFGYDPHINRLFSTWLDPNLLGGLLAMILVLFLSIRGAPLPLALLLIAIALFLTYSRSSYLAFFVGIVIIGLFKSPRLLIILLILASIGIGFSERAQQRVGELAASIISTFIPTENADPTARLRFQNWQQTIELIKQKPVFGHGYNNLAVVKLKEGFISSEDIHSASGSDSSLLTVFATTGALGLLSFLAIFYTILSTSWKKFRHPPSLSTSKNNQSFGLALFAATTSLLVHSIFVNSLFLPEIMIFYWISTAVLFEN